MNLNNIENAVPVNLENRRINHFTFDGCDYFFTLHCKREIVCADMNFCEKHTFKTVREYDCLCYDFCENCFWASSPDEENRIFKLDSFMREIDCLKIRSLRGYAGRITGISYNCCQNCLLVSFPGAVAMVNKENGEAALIYKESSCWITGVMSLCPYYLITEVKESKQFVTIMGDDNTILHRENIGDGAIMTNMIFNPKTGKGAIECLAVRNSFYSYIWSFDMPCCGCFCKLCPCNHILNERCCEDCPCCGCGDVIESVAMVERALARILNAEGAKLQKTLAITDDIKEILCVNREVNETLINATHLEQTLYAKLQALRDNGCDLCEDRCHK